MMTRVVVILLSLVALSPWAATADPYINSSECDPADPNLLLCDSFEDGDWYRTTANPSDAQNDGWCGTIYANPITPPGAALCNGAGAAGTACTATHRQSGANGGNMADHALRQGVRELYVRWYTRFLPGYVFGDEKMLTFNKGGACVGGIWFGDFVARGNVLSFLNYGVQTWRTQNVGAPLAFVPGPWYYLETHLNLDTGRLRLWMNDCGASGVCTGTPTLRMDYTGLPLQRAAGDLISSLWFENWAHPGRSGERYLDQIKVSKVGPIGFVGAVAPPPPPPPPQTFTLTADVAPVGGGTVTGGGTYPAGTSVTVHAMPNLGYTFAGWSGACTGTGDCVVIMDAPWVVTANFAVVQPPPPPPPPSAITGTCRWTFTPDAINPLAVTCP